MKRKFRKRFDSNDDPFGTIDLGRCCHCGTVDHVVNILCLHVKAPVPGSGWGCAVCGVPSNGAVAVLCNSCTLQNNPPLFACFGSPTDGERVSVRELSTPFVHDLSFHPEMTRGAA